MLASAVDYLPPTPLTSFLSQRPDLVGAVISGYDAAFADPAYHTNYDVSIDASAVERAASLLARSLFRLALDAEEKETALSLEDIAVDQTLVSELISSFTDEGLSSDVTAPFVKEEAAAVSTQAGSSIGVDWGSAPPSFYTSVFSPNSGQPLFVRDGVSYSRWVTLGISKYAVQYFGVHVIHILNLDVRVLTGLRKRGKAQIGCLCTLQRLKCSCVLS